MARAVADDSGVAYVVTVPDDAAQPLQFQLHVPFTADVVHLFFDDVSHSSKRPHELVAIEAYTSSGQALHIDKSAAGYTIDAGGEPFVIQYALKLQPTLMGSSTLPHDRAHSLRWDDYAYIAADALLQGSGWGDGPAHIRFQLPGDWQLFVSDAGVAQDGAASVRKLHETSVFIGRDLRVHPVPASVGLTLVEAGALPWPTEQVADALATLLDPLYELGVTEATDHYTFVIARYPGALRFNPLISSHLAGDRTFIHWVGVGTIDWWRKHSISDVVTLLTYRTLNLAPDAGWFRTGLAEYASLLLLFESGYLSVDEMYQSLHNMYVTGARYTGPAWPSLILAGISEPKSHAAERVLQFRSPVTAFLLDIELRAASDGTVSILDLWASLAERQRLQRDVPLHTADLLPPSQQFGDLSAFADEHIFGTHVSPLHFDTVFNRWFAALRR